MDRDVPKPAFARRTHFYVGGHLETVTQSFFGESTLLVGQVYIESLEPFEIKQKWPIVMIPGGGQTGANFLNTPDGRPGWADYFLKRGYHVYIAEQPARGRSAWLPDPDPKRVMETIPQEFCARQWTAPEKHNPYEQAKYHTQWPGPTGLPGEAAFDAFYASQVPFVMNFNYSEALMQPAGLALLERIGPSILLTHSQSGLYAWGIADVAQPKGLVKAVIALEPTGPPFVDRLLMKPKGAARPYGITSIPLTYEPPIDSADELRTIACEPPTSSGDTLMSSVQQDPAQPGGPRRLPHLQGFPILIVTSQASNHAAYDHGTVQYLREAGVEVTWFKLAEMGILGNAHFMFLERNSDEIARVIADWLEDVIEK